MSINGSRVAVDLIGQRLLVSLPPGFPDGSPLAAEFEFTLGFEALRIDATPIADRDTFVFPAVSSGLVVPVSAFLSGGSSVDYDIVFTELPTIELRAPTIVDEPKMPGSLGICDGVQGMQLPRLAIGIETRGGAALWWTKKSYGLELENGSLRLLEMREDNDWILDGSFIDPSLLRNRVAHDLFLSMRGQAHAGGGKSTIDGQFVELILNDRYHGIYILSERVDRKLLKLSKTSAYSVLYKAYGNSANFYNADLPAEYEQKHPASSTPYWGPLEELYQFVSQSSDLEFTAQVRERIEFDSIIDWWLIVVLGACEDNIAKNYYLGRSGEGSWFFAPWDMDGSYGIFWNGEKRPRTNWWPIGNNNLIRRLTELPSTGFNQALQARWAALRNDTWTHEALMARFQDYALMLTRSGAYERTFDRWAQWSSASTVEEVLDLDELSNWIRGRLEFLDTKMAGLPAL